MKILKTVYNSRLIPPLGYVVEVGDKKRRFEPGQEKEAGAWIMSVWEDEFFPPPALVYYNYGFIGDNLALYCEYRPDE